jgi:hypothetical protein
MYGKSVKDMIVDVNTIRECLELLRKVDDLLMANDEIEIAVHLSMAIEKLALKLPE